MHGRLFVDFSLAVDRVRKPFSQMPERFPRRLLLPDLSSQVSEREEDTIGEWRDAGTLPPLLQNVQRVVRSLLSSQRDREVESDPIGVPSGSRAAVAVTVKVTVSS